jgi:putative acetyltransferase
MATIMKMKMPHAISEKLFNHFHFDLPMVRLVAKHDNAAIASIIRAVMPEFGASGQGFAIHDKEVDNIFEAYSRPRCSYYVFERDGKILGGAGIAPLEGGDPDVCELKKMYFLQEARGMGAGEQVLKACLAAAKKMSYNFCYLETFNTMRRAMKLYEKLSFKEIEGPMGNTGHFACDRFYLLKL